MSEKFYVYILECADTSYYVGITNDLPRRLIEHNFSPQDIKYTFSRRPVVLKYYEEFEWVLDAIKREKQLKGWKWAKKDALINKNILLLVELSNHNKLTSSLAEPIQP